MNLDVIRNEIRWKKIRYERTLPRSLGNASCCVEFEIQEDENFLERFDFAQATVDSKLGLHVLEMEDKRTRLQLDIAELKEEKKQLDAEIKRGAESLKKIIDYCREANLNPDTILNLEFPI
ncbi:hypothetical protein Riv7116_2106 [Rivularia sp. PCC 7116]|uniref:hypothetical protein n=1 Tax=Rivularia sp. PCC 7116 TaxID=373994 RepID=UPI00029F0BA6|nr:hypothetical protein [Rivularia sp. PCC 7116]AFY54637.1 hypothetical protein Riv7116_2106 [Rivularia sp. PCC 7116]